MTYFYNGLTYHAKQWFVRLNIPSKGELMDSVEYVTANFKTYKPICLLLDSAKKQDPKNGHTYRMVTMGHQIDDCGNLIFSDAWNIRQQVCKSNKMEAENKSINAPLVGVRYATQYDFDKFCFENPNDRYPFDWNAEVYKAFISPIRVMMK